MIESALVFLGKFLFYAIVSIVSIVLVWVVGGALFCMVVCGLSSGGCAFCKAWKRRFAHHHNH
jgi:hypothetical protein